MLERTGGQVFLEHVPHTLAGWLADHRNAGVTESGIGSPCPWGAEALARGTAFPRARGLVHFDAHFASILTDGRRLYFADCGPALSSRFDLSADEAAFHSAHLAYDHCYTATHLLRHHLLDGVRDGTERDVFLRDWIAGRRPGDLPPEIAALIDRHARPAVVLDDFHRRFLTESKRTPFPTAEIERAVGVRGRAVTA